jgi:hypothetical protein
VGKKRATETRLLLEHRVFSEQNMHSMGTFGGNRARRGAMAVDWCVTAYSRLPRG